MSNTYGKAIAKRFMLQNKFNKNRFYEKLKNYKRQNILCSNRT